MYKNLLFAIVLITISGCSPRKSSLEDSLLSGSDFFIDVIENPKHEVQIIYGEIIDDTIIHHYYNRNTNQFFYPASTVKMLAAFAAVHKLNEDSLNIESIIFQDSSTIHPRVVSYDSLANEPESIESLLKQIFVLSDNRAYNILFSWLGKDYINSLFKKYDVETRVVHQLSETAFSFRDESNNFTANTTIIDTVGRAKNYMKNVKKYPSHEQYFVSRLNPTNQRKGKGYVNATGEIVLEPFDFTRKNFVPLESLLTALEQATRPDLLRKNKTLDLGVESRETLMDIMALRPSDIKHGSDSLADNYVKFLMMGDMDEMTYSESIIIRNKVGWAYGYLTDVAYIVDKTNKVSFFLAATIHVNENEIYNDGVYEYEEIGLPFLGELGRLIHRQEIEKKEGLN